MQDCSNSFAYALELQQSCTKSSIDSLVQVCNNSIANALELLQSCTKPSLCSCPNVLPIELTQGPRAVPPHPGIPYPRGEQTDSRAATQSCCQQKGCIIRIYDDNCCCFFSRAIVVQKTQHPIVHKLQLSFMKWCNKQADISNNNTFNFKTTCISKSGSYFVFCFM